MNRVADLVRGVALTGPLPLQLAIKDSYEHVATSIFGTTLGGSEW